MPGLDLATNGNFYGVNSNGGAGNGVAFEITAGGALTTLYDFGFADGANPGGALVEGSNGNFYGTATNGGISGCGPTGDGCGVIFEMTPDGTVIDLHNFDGSDGLFAGGGAMIRATDGNFYGDASAGGISDCPNGCGVIFKITPGGAFTLPHMFDGTDGSGPNGGLVQATDGNFYGATHVGGALGGGTVFKITPKDVLTTLHNFGGSDGPFASGVIQATDGNFYGTTHGGGANGYGMVFELTPTGTFTDLHDFDGTDGANPSGRLVQATTGKLYGTTYAGGAYGYGTIFSVSMGLGPFVAFVRPYGKVGKTIEILGQGLTGTTSVSFNGSPGTFSVHGSTVIWATVPAGATTGFVTVTTPTQTLTSNVQFEVLQ